MPFKPLKDLWLDEVLAPWIKVVVGVVVLLSCLLIAQGIYWLVHLL